MSDEHTKCAIRDVSELRSEHLMLTFFRWINFQCYRLQEWLLTGGDL